MDSCTVFYFWFVLLDRFKLKYHPEECEKRQDEVRMALLKRLRVFTELMQQDRLESIMLDIDNTEDIIKVLDAGKMVVMGFYIH